MNKSKDGQYDDTRKGIFGGVNDEYASNEHLNKTQGDTKSANNKEKNPCNATEKSKADHANGMLGQG